MNKSIGSVREALVKKFDYVKRPFSDIEPFSTGALMVDAALGIGGWPRGRVAELFGPESSGKSTLALASVPAAQALGMYVIYLDFERTFSESYANMMGVDTSPEVFMPYRPRTLEDGADIIEHYLKAGVSVYCIIDSVPAMLPAAHGEMDMSEEGRVGEQARKLSMMLRRLIPQIEETDSFVVFINHIHTVIGGRSYGPPQTTTPGGVALKYYSSVRVELRLLERIKENVEDLETGKLVEDTNAMKVQAIVIKNKTSRAWKKATFIMRPPYGVSDVDTVVDVGISRGLIERKGPYYAVPIGTDGEFKSLQGKAKALQYFKDAPEHYAELRSRLIDCICGGSEVVAVEAGMDAALHTVDDVRHLEAAYEGLTEPETSDAPKGRGRPKKVSL